MDDSGLAPTLTASNDPSRSPQSSEVTRQVESVLAATGQVRRLSPTECESLQGFPPGWTGVPWGRRASSPDSARYKSVGNSMPVPVMIWIASRVSEPRIGGRGS